MFNSISRPLLRTFLLAMFCALLAACTSPPPPAPPKVASRIERIEASLRAMNFEKHDDGWHLLLPAPLTFAFDSDSVTPEARANLQLVVRELRQLGIDRLMVRGHTDTVGAAEYNMALSKRRADAVARVLIEGGYPAERIDSRGLGSTVPIADNSTAEGRSQNRRVVIIVQVI